MKILITGGTGLVGKALVSKLREKGHFVNILVRKNPKNENEFLWDYSKKEIDEKAFEGIDTIIHLAGASIGKRWTKEYKREIISSRVDSAKFLKEKCSELGVRLKSFISASGINYYGTFTNEKILTENDGIFHQDFLSEVCVLWEKSADEFTEISDKIVKIRTAPVLSKKGGTFEQLKKITDYNLASGIGSGKQWFNWIYLEDLVEIYIKSVVDSNIKGIYNAVADEIPTNQNFMKKLASERKKFFIPFNVPGFLMKLVLGEMSEIILEGTKVSNQKIKNSGFVFKYPDLNSTFKNILEDN